MCRNATQEQTQGDFCGNGSWRPLRPQNLDGRAAASKTTQDKSNNFARSPARHRENVKHLMGFPGGSDGREAACTVGDGGSFPGLGRSLEEGKATPHFNIHKQKNSALALSS